MDGKTKVLIWSNEHSGWWKPNEQGYTTERKVAGRYEFDRAFNIVRSANRHNGGKPPNETIEFLDERDEDVLICNCGVDTGEFGNDFFTECDNCQDPTCNECLITEFKGLGGNWCGEVCAKIAWNESGPTCIECNGGGSREHPCYRCNNTGTEPLIDI